MKKRAGERRRYYDVERFRRVYLETLGKRRGVWRVFGGVTRFVDSVQGIFVAFLMPVLVFGTLVGVVLSASFGLWAFLAFFGSVIGGLAFVVEKRVGRSLQFGEGGFFHSLVPFVGLVILAMMVLAVTTFRLGLR